MSEDEYAKCFSEYLSEISTPQLPHWKPLWQVHVLNNNSHATTLVFKVHHSIGDGHSLMGVLLSPLHRADDPSLPITFPSIKPPKVVTLSGQASLRRIPSFASNFFASIKDFGWSLLKSSLHEDDKTPIRSEQERVEFQPAVLSSSTFPLDHVRNIKSKLGVTVNDVITGIVFYGIRLYMQDVDYSSRTKNCTLLPMLNTRNIQSYDTKNNNNNIRMRDTKVTWGNKFTYTHVSFPTLTDTRVSDPLQFVWEAHHTMKMKKRRSLVYSLISMLLRVKHQFNGPEAVAKHFHNTLRNSSILISNMVGPLDQLAIADFPIKNLYFSLSGVPQSLVITIISYMGMLRVTTRAEEGFIDEKKLESCINDAFEMIHKSALEIRHKTKFMT